MGYYSVVIHDPDGETDFTFAVQPGIDMEDVERIHRRGSSPNTLGAIVRRMTLRGAIDDSTPPGVVGALATFLQVHINRRALPSYVRILDSGGTVLVADIGAIDTSDPANGWEEMEIVGFRIPGVGEDPAQLVAGVEFELVIQGRKVFPDANGVWFLEQTYEDSGQESGQPERSLTTVIKISEEAYGNGTRIAGLLSTAGAVLPSPVGWHRVGLSNTSVGAQIRYTRYPLLTEAVVTSVVRKLPSGQTVNSLVGGASLLETTLPDPRLGLTRTRLDATQVGGSSPLTDVQGRDPSPGQSLAVTGWDKLENRAQGSFETRGPASSYLAGKVTACETSWRLVGGRRRVVEIPIGGTAAPILDSGPHRAWVLVERSTVTALGPTSLDEMPLPEPADPTQWLLDDEQHGLPVVADYAGGRNQHVWQRTVTRSYYWRGYEAPPLSDPAVRAMFMDQWLQGTDRVRQLEQISGS